MLSNRIAWRYLWGKKSTQAINIISGMCILGMTLGTAALILILSVFNGFESVIGDFSGRLHPDIKISAARGKTFEINSDRLAVITHTPGVRAVAQSLEDLVLYRYGDNQALGYLRGVDDTYRLVTEIDSCVQIGRIDWADQELTRLITGLGLARNLGLRLDDPILPLEIFRPKKGRRRVMDNPFRKVAAVPTGYFSTLQEIDQTHAIAPLDAVQKILQTPDRISAYELKISADADIHKIISTLKSTLGADFKILNRYEQDADFYHIVRIEKWVTTAIFTLVILLIAFNLIGALWMIVLEKQSDLRTLNSLGADESLIRHIVRRTGLMICGIGVLAGIALALILYTIHIRYGLVPLPDHFIVDRYPMELRWTDVAITIGIVSLVSYLASHIPAIRAGQLSTDQKTS